MLFLAFSAAASAEGFDYNYVLLGYGNTDFDNFDADGDGFVLGGSYAVTDSLHAFASYEAADLDTIVPAVNADVTRWNVGIGYNTSISDALDMYARLSYENLDFDPPGAGNLDDTGYGFSVGTRYRFDNQLELNAAINHVDYGDFGDDTGFEVGGLYSINDTWSVGLSGEWSDDVSTYTLSGRFYFGR